MMKDDDLAGLDIEETDSLDWQEEYYDYLDAVLELKEERRMCQRYIPCDEYNDE